MSTPRVIVTGAAGFIGRHVARRFAQSGWQVVGVGHGIMSPERALEWGITEWHAADVTCDALLNASVAPDAVIHCAGSGAVSYSLSHPYQDFHRSCGSIAAVLEYARLSAPAARIVYLSSAAVYGQTGSGPISEGIPVSPVSPYGFHKFFGESLCQMYGTYYGVPSAIIRLFSIYGAGLSKQLLWDACNRSRSGNLEFGGTGDETRDWLHVSDASELIFHAVNHAATICPIANGGTGDAPTVRAVLTVLLRRLGLEQDPQFSGAGRPGDPKWYRADISAAREWGWAPKIDWRAGIESYADWYRSGQT